MLYGLLGVLGMFGGHFIGLTKKRARRGRLWASDVDGTGSWARWFEGWGNGKVLLWAVCLCLTAYCYFRLLISSI